MSYVHNHWGGYQCKISIGDGTFFIDEQKKLFKKFNSHNYTKPFDIKKWQT